MLTIDQYSNYYLLSGRGEGTAASTKAAATSEDTMATQEIPTVPAAPTQPVPTSDRTHPDRNAKIKELETYWQTPLTDDDRTRLAAINKTLDIRENLDITAERPDFPERHNGDYVHNLQFGMLRIVGMGSKQDEIDSLVQGDPLDYRVQREYEDVLAGIEMGDPAWSLKDLTYADTMFPGTLAYAREAIFQRSSIEHGTGIDIGRIMHENGIIDDQQFAALAPLSMPSNSAKLQAYAARVEAARDADPEVETPGESVERPAPENSIFLTVDEAQDFTSPDPKFKVYVVKSATNAYENVNTSAVVKDMWVDARGNIQVPSGYLLEELLA